MLNVGPSTRIFLAAGVTDMRKSYDTLAALVTHALGHDPLSGHVFLFSNRARNRLKALVWESSGFWLLSKRLERGTFAWPDAETRAIELSPPELALLLGGIDLRETKERRWYRRAPSASRMKATESRRAQRA